MRTSFHHQSEAQPPNGPLTAVTSPDTPSAAQQASPVSNVSHMKVHAAGTRRVSAAGLAPPSGEIVTQIQIGGSSTDSLVRILHAQPRSRLKPEVRKRKTPSRGLRSASHSWPSFHEQGDSVRALDDILPDVCRQLRRIGRSHPKALRLIGAWKGED